MYRDKEKRNILALEAVAGRQIGLRRRFNTKLSGGTIKRSRPEEFSANNHRTHHKKTKVLDLNEFNVGIEIETCCDDALYLKYFDRDVDSSIRCKKKDQVAVEFILNLKGRKYFQQKNRENIKMEMQTIFDKCKMCDNDRGQSTCGIHIHLSHPDLTKNDYPSFAKVFSQYWISSLYNHLKEKYSLRENNVYCKKNTRYDTDRHEKYRQLNFLPSDDEDEVWHFEFRGMGDIHTVSVELIDAFVEELAMGFTNSFQLKLDVDFKKELWKVLHHADYAYKNHISTIIELLREAKWSGKPIDLDQQFDLDKSDDETILNNILYRTRYKAIDKGSVKEILKQAKNVGPYRGSRVDPYWVGGSSEPELLWYGPLYWIEWHDKQLAIELIPYFKKRKYEIKEKFSKEVRDAWSM